MHTECSGCGKRLVTGHDLKYQLNISFLDLFNHNIWDKKRQQQKLYCEKCKDIAEKEFERIMDAFNKEG